MAVALTILFAAIPATQAQTPSRQKPAMPPASALINAARVGDTLGKVEMKVSGRAPYVPFAADDMLSPQTTIRTGEGAAALLILPGGHLLRIGERSVVQLAQLGENNSYSIKVLSGVVWSRVRKLAASKPIQYEVTTPSAICKASDALFSVGYQLESDLSTVAVTEGTASVSLVSGGWNGTIKAGQYIPVLRRPQPNIRLRSPEVTAQDESQKAIWRVLRQENWTRSNLAPNTKPKLSPKSEEQLRKYLNSAIT